MNTKHLKAKILDLAIRGKLVPQDSSEGNASDLLKKIREEKNILIEQKKIKADKNSSFIIKAEDGRHYEQLADRSLIDVEDEIPFEIPGNWCWCRLREITTILGDGLHGTPKYNKNGDYYFINGNNLENGKIIIKSDTQKVDDAEYQKYKKELNDNTVLVSINGTIGNIAFYNNEKIILGKSACYFNLISPSFKNFIYLLIKTSFFLVYATTNATGSTIKNVSLDTMRNFLFPLPPLSEQQRIVSAIEKAFEQIDIIEKNKLNLKTYIKQTKSKVLDLAIHGKLVKQNPKEGNARDLLDNSKIESDDIPFEIPNSWCWCKLDEIGETNIGLTYHPQDISADGIPVLRSNNINNNKLVLNDLVRVKTRILNNQYVKNGDILICARNGSKRLIGKCAILENLKEEISFGAFMAIFRSNYNQYILRYLQSQHFKNYLRNSNSTQINQITQIMLKNCPLPLPPLYEQKRIVKKIEQIFEQLDILEKSLGE